MFNKDIKVPLHKAELVGTSSSNSGDIDWPWEVLFFVLLGYQPLTDGICDDVLDVVEGTAGETVIELTQEENGIKEIYDSEKKMYT